MRFGLAPQIVLLLMSWLPRTATAAADAIELERLVDGLRRPLLVTQPADGSGRLFVVEQGGRVLIWDGEQLAAEPFLDLSGRLSTGGERGLLGLAFHPDFAANGFFFVNYTDRSGDTVVARFSVSADRDRADAESETMILSFDQPFANHNGGHLAFGPDGYLYIASGDGGSGGDPQNNAQSLDTLLGKILRVDVDGRPMAIPPDNPFVGRAGTRDEIWAYGLRNPWRFSFDRRNGDLWIGDVGQGREEEVNRQVAASRGGENYGWRRLEGSLCFEPAVGCGDPSFTAPVLVYRHGPHCSVTGGFRYRGRRAPGLRGLYLFGDFCSGVIWGARLVGGVWSASVLADTRLAISSFGEDQEGELYVVDYGGVVYRLASSAILIDGFESADTSAWDRTRGNVRVVRPGLGGSGHALAVELNGTAERSFVLTKAPRRESSLGVAFRLDANRARLGGEEVDLLHLLGGGAHVRLTLRPRGSRYQASLWVRQSDGELVRVGGTRIRRSGSVRLAIEWVRASSADAEDGQARLIRGRRVRAERLDLANGAFVVQSLAAGLPAGSVGAVEGRLLLDEFAVTR